MKINSFEELISWQKSKVLSVEVYKTFKSCKDHSFCDQIQRASVSVMNNIAEGFERETNNELKRFLYIAKGSCGETKSMLLLGNELGYIENEKLADLTALTTDISKLIYGLIRKLA